MTDLEDFAEKLAHKGLSQPDSAVALLWFHDQQEHGVAVGSKRLAEELHDTGLFSVVNATRLATQLARHSHVVRGKVPGTVRIKTSARPSLDGSYADLLGKRAVRASDALLPREQFKDRRKGWQELVAEINGCYDYGFFDGAAVLCRRLVEVLIVEVFRAKKIEAAIKTPKGENMMFDGLIGVLVSGAHIKLSKSARPALEPIKTVGDIAAHSAHHITTKQDVDGIANQVRVVVSELLAHIDHP